MVSLKKEILNGLILILLWKCFHMIINIWIKAMEEYIEKDDILKDFLDSLGIDENITYDTRRISPLVLAYLGDAVYEWYIRYYLLASKRGSAHHLHKRAIKYVKASSQAYAIKHIDHILTDEERSIVRRARNQKPQTIPKNATLADYSYATAMEALLGYLMLKNQKKRVEQIMGYVIERINEQK